MVNGLIVSNGTFNVSRLSTDVVTSTGDVMMLIGMALVAAVALGIIYAIYLILKGG
jgi:hypothetical protein